jgi:hypothetical protein
MSTVGQIEKRTQARVVALFRDRLKYDYLGNWIDREGHEGKGNRNIEPEYVLGYRALRERDRAGYAGAQAFGRLGIRGEVTKNAKLIAVTMQHSFLSLFFLPL